MLSRLRTLAGQSMAYGLGSVAAKLLAIVLLPIYTRYLTPSDYGHAELVLTIDLFFVAFVRFGLQNAMMRFWYRHRDDGRQDDVVRATLTVTFLTSLVGVSVLAALARPIASFLFGDADQYTLILIGALGMWCSTHYGTLNAVLRLQRRPRAFVGYSLANIAFSATFTVLFVVVLGWKAEGLLLGNFLGTLAVIPPLAFSHRRFLRPTRGRGITGPMLRFGFPTLPMAIAVQARPLVDRSVLVKVAGPDAVGIYALGIRLSTVVQLAVTALQLSWQPFAYSIKDDEDARATYAEVMSWYVALGGWLVVATALLADPMVRLLTQPAFYDAAPLVPLLAGAAGIYGVSFIGGIPAGRVEYSRHYLHGAITAVVVTVIGNGVLVPRFEAWGAAISLLAANTAMSTVMVHGSQRRFRVPYQWWRMVRVLVVIVALAAITPLLDPGDEPSSVLLRLALAAAYLPLILATGFFGQQERQALARLRARRRARKADKRDAKVAREAGATPDPRVESEIDTLEDIDS